MKVLLIQTGGTIDKDYPRVIKGYAFEIGKPAVERILEKINPNFTFEIAPLLQKDSTEITKKDREKIFQYCKDSEAKKILITHGTDTMIETAEKLSSISGKVIVITGAMRPEMFSNSDAMFNVGSAMGALNVIEEGVYIAMNGRVYKWNECARDIKTGQFVKK